MGADDPSDDAREVIAGDAPAAGGGNETRPRIGGNEPGSAPVPDRRSIP